MKNKGFTLIELLAVIVILAIISIIAVPIMLNVIDKAKKGAAESSALGYIDAAEKQVMINKVKDSNSIGEGEYTKTELESKGLSIKGEVTNALVLVNNKGKITQGRFCIDGYSIDYDGKETKINTETDYCEKILSILNPCEIPVGTEYTFDYTGSEQTFTAGCNGKYMLEAWGAEGSTYVSTAGKGGYSVGISELAIDDIIYVTVGGQGSGTTGGYNGGGAAAGRWNQTSWHEAADWGSGGGATHMSLDSGLLSTLASHATDGRILIVAGGGGGGEHWWSTSGSSTKYLQGGHGGGYIGTKGENYHHGVDGGSAGGSQTDEGHPFGQGEGEAGGGYYGGGGGGTYTAGAGGSGYIASSKLISNDTVTKHMACYNCSGSLLSNDTETKTIAALGSSTTAQSDYAKEGNGYAKITYLGK